jgi:hypothetical protein
MKIEYTCAGSWTWVGTNISRSKKNHKIIVGIVVVTRIGWCIAIIGQRPCKEDRWDHFEK